MQIGSWWGKLRERDDSKDLGLDGGDNIKMYFKCINWIGLAQVGGKWRAVVDTVLNLQAP